MTETAPAPISPARLLLWSIRRELWENRSILIGPPIAAGVVLLGFLLSTPHLPDRMRALAAMDPAAQAQSHAERFGTSALPLLATMLIVAAAYCLGALHNERRDRSILFWKSLPVSDRITVLAKAAVPLLVLPLVTYAAIVAIQLVILVASLAILLATHAGAGVFWAGTPVLQIWLALLYGLVAMSLWYAPVYTWLLLVSAWARRTPFLWAVLPPLGLAIIERIAFDTSHLFHFLGYRAVGWFAVGFDRQGAGGGALAKVDPIGLLTSPGLWLGLAASAAFVAAASWLRRTREPI